MTKEGAQIRGLVGYRTNEVDPMLARLATVNDPDHLANALAAVIASGARFKFTSELETAILAHLGHRTTPEAQRNATDARRLRRARGLDCPQCHDTGWTVDDDDNAHPCDCTPRPAPQPDAWISPRTQPRADPDTMAAWLGRARDALKPTDTEGDT